MSCKGQYFNLDSRLGLDDCALVANEKQNIEIKDYELFNPIEDCTDRTFEKVAECNNMVINNGYGNSNSCNIDIDSRLRNGGEITNHNVLNQKFRKCQECDDDKNAIENRIKRGNDFGLKRCDVISEISTLDLQFTPMIPCLSHNIQNSSHIVFEPSKIVWGGAPTRDSLQQKKFLETQGFKFNKQGITDQACGFR